MLLAPLPTIAVRQCRWAAPRLAYAGVLVLAAGLFLVNLGDRALWSMELRWAEIPREMRESGNYFRPTINGRLYYDKPLGSYWLVVAAGWLTGRDDEFAARLPSVASGLLAVALLMHLARRLYDHRTATLAALILTTSFAFIGFARTASADMENVAGELTALALYLHLRRRPNAWAVVGLWLVMALTSLTKGLLGFALPLVVITAERAMPTALRGHVFPTHAQAKPWAWHPGRLSFLWSRASLLGATLAAVVYLAPFAASGGDAGSGLALVFRENIQRFIAPHNHRGPIYLYAYVIFGLLAPWSLFLPAALVHAHSRRSSTPTDDGDRFSLIYFWATFAFFTLSASRRSYYLLPILPAAALLLARLFTTPADALSVWSRRLLRIGFGILTVMVIAAGSALVPLSGVLPARWADLPPVPARVAFALGWLACLLTVGFTWWRLRPARIAGATGLVASLAMTYLFAIALPATEQYRGERPFAATVRDAVGPDSADLALYHTRELVYYLGYAKPLVEFDTPAELVAAIREGQVKWLILRRRDLAAVPAPIEVGAAEAEYPWEGPDERLTKAVLLRLY